MDSVACVSFPSSAVNENIPLRNRRVQFPIFTKATSLTLIWKNIKWDECHGRLSACPKISFIEFNHFVPPSKNTYQICNIQAEWIVPLSFRNSELLWDFLHTLLLFHCHISAASWVSWDYREKRVRGHAVSSRTKSHTSHVGDKSGSQETRKYHVHVLDPHKSFSVGAVAQLLVSAAGYVYQTPSPH